MLYFYVSITIICLILMITLFLFSYNHYRILLYITVIIIIININYIPLHAGLCRGRPNTSLATHGIMMEITDLNKSLCEKVFGGELDVTEKALNFLQGENSQVNQYREWFYERKRKELES